MRSNTPSLREWFDSLLDIAPEARHAFFDENGIGKEQRHQLERMLAARSQPESALPGTPPDELARAFVSEDGEHQLRPGSRIGPFDLVGVVGEGGSSTVFRAERTVDGVRQTIALKMLRHGVYTQDAKRQFRRERLALSQLQHPGIARFIEGGVTEAGVAYIALDFVDGVSITEYVRERKLDLRARLLLFLEVCRAVEAAHRALIVHRDLKPANVLVTAEGDIKLVDFGIAKLLDIDDDLQTRLPAFTPAYAAPEQKSGAPITTATDVYALGVLLGEIITGQRINDGSGRTPSGQVGADTAPGVLPAAPAITRRQLRGDLDNIVLKAVTTEPERRYASAGAFADDIQRLLDSRPVDAHPPSAWYRTRKFVARHRGSVASTALVAIAILAALGIALWQAKVARQEAERADAVRDFLVSVFKSADTSVPRDTRPSVDDLIRTATDRLDRETKLTDAVRADLLLTLAQVAASVSSFKEARRLLDEGEPLLDRLSGADDPRRWDAVLTRAIALSGSEPSAEVIKLLYPLRERMLARHDADSIEALLLLGDALMAEPRQAEGFALIQRTREIADTTPNTPLETRLLASTEEAGELNGMMRFREGIDRAEAALQIWHQMGDTPNNSIADLDSSIGVAAEALGDIARADSAYREAIAIDERFFDKPNAQTAWDLGIYATFLIAQGRLVEAEPYAMRALEMRRQVLGEKDDRTLYAIAGMAKLRFAQRRYEDAAQWLSQGIDTCRGLAAGPQVCARLLAMRAGDEAMLRRFTDADRDMAEAEDRQRPFGGETSNGYAYVLTARVVVQIQEGKYADAVATSDRVLAIYHDDKGGMLQALLAVHFRRALALFELHRDDEALSEVLAIEPKYSALFAGTGTRAEILALKARALARAGRAEEARAAAEQALSVNRATNALAPEASKELERIAAPRGHRDSVGLATHSVRS